MTPDDFKITKEKVLADPQNPMADPQPPKLNSECSTPKTSWRIPNPQSPMANPQPPNANLPSFGVVTG